MHAYTIIPKVCYVPFSMMPLKNYNLISGPRQVHLVCLCHFSIREVLCKRMISLSHSIPFCSVLLSCSFNWKRTLFLLQQSCTNLWHECKLSMTKQLFLKKKKKKILTFFCPPAVYGESADRRSNSSKTIKSWSPKCTTESKSKTSMSCQETKRKPTPSLRKHMMVILLCLQSFPWSMGNTI